MDRLVFVVNNIILVNLCEVKVKEAYSDMYLHSGTYTLLCIVLTQQVDLLTQSVFIGVQLRYTCIIATMYTFVFFFFIGQISVADLSRGFGLAAQVSMLC